VRVPTLHVWSTGDPFLGRAATEATGQFVDAPYRLEVLDDVSHWIPELAPDHVAKLVTAHVRSA
jgi:pimeloyl-ACP methyl ester carboxylesterase